MVCERCEWFSKRAKFKQGQIVVFAHGNLARQHKPLTIKLGRWNRTVTVSICSDSKPYGVEENRVLQIPIENVWIKKPPRDKSQDSSHESNQTSTEQANEDVIATFNRFLASVWETSGKSA